MMVYNAQHDINIYVEKQIDGYFVAYDYDNYEPGNSIGYGKSAIEALDELYENMDNCLLGDKQNNEDSHARPIS